MGNQTSGIYNSALVCRVPGGALLKWERIFKKEEGKTLSTSLATLKELITNFQGGGGDQRPRGRRELVACEDIQRPLSVLLGSLGSVPGQNWKDKNFLRALMVKGERLFSCDIILTPGTRQCKTRIGMKGEPPC